MPFVADVELLHHPPAALVARHDADLDPVQAQLLERELDDHDHRFGDVAVAGVGLVDPVADRAGLHRAAGDVVQVDLARDVLVEEQPELVRGAVRSVAVALEDPGHERRAIGHRVGLVRVATGLPHRQPVVVAAADLAPFAEVVGRQRAQHDPLAVEAQRCGRTGRVP